MNASVNRRHVVYLALAVAFITCVVYLPALRNDFVSWDDDVYVLDNVHIRVFDGTFLRWAFTTLYQGFWHPLTWLSHAADVAIWGMNPAGHHLTGILIHTANVFLVVLLTARLVAAASSDQRTILIASCVTGLLFGVHPLHVESVVWVAERKDVLCAFFLLLSIVAYVRYVSLSVPAADQRGNAPPTRPLRMIQGGKEGVRVYMLSLVLFMAALASKTMAVSLPVVLLILDWYPFGRIVTRRDLFARAAEKAPFAVCSLLIAVISMIAQRAHGAMGLMETTTVATRVLVAFQAVVFYLQKMLLPLDLLPLYPYPKEVAFQAAAYYSSVAVVTGITAACVVMARRSRLWLSAWGCYLVPLLPVLGLVPVGIHPWADRFTYLPGLAPFLVAGLAAAWAWRLAAGHPGAFRRGVVVPALVLVAVCIFLTVRQTGIWKDSITLWSYVIEKKPGLVPAAYVNRGVMLALQNRTGQALEDFNEAIRLDPANPLARNNRGKIYRETGRAALALEDFTEAIRSAPSYHVAYNNRGLAYRDLKLPDKALADYTMAVGMRPDYAPAYTNRGRLFYELGRTDDAVRDFTAAISANPFYAEAYISRGLLMERAGRVEDALRDYNRSISLNPASGDAYLNRGVVFERMNRFEQAVADYTKAISLNSRDSLAYRNRGEAYARMGRKEDAIRDQLRACELGNEEGCAIAGAYGAHGN